MKKKREQLWSNPYAAALAAVFCCALWGSAFPFIKIGYRLFEIPASDTGGQILFAGIRFALAGIATILLGSGMERTLLLPKQGMAKPIVFLSLAQTVLQYAAFYAGLALTSGVRASILQGVNVFFALAVSAWVFHLERLNGRKLFGCLLGFLGIVLMHWNGELQGGGMQLLGDGLILASAMAYAFSSSLMKQYSREYSPVVLSGYQFLLGGLFLALIGWRMGGRMSVPGIGAVLVLGYLALLSAMAYALWGILLKHNPISAVTVYGFMTPVFGFVFSALLLDEGQDAASVSGLAALACVCAGIFLVNREQKTNLPG